ncbi:hypothetical protein ACHAXT_004397 [Thalassiosira profunda]
MSTEEPNDGAAAAGSEDAQGGIKETISEGAEAVNDTLSTSPTEWSTGQIVGVAVGAAAALFLFLGVCYCCRKRRKGGSTGRRSTRQRMVATRRGAIANGAQKSYVLQRPYIIRSSGQAVSTSHLPRGAILHGAEKLRLAKLTGAGVRVAVIDSGIDANHPALDGVVRKKKWYRAGTPLIEDDHGTHVAGTIHFMAPQAELYDYRVFGATGEDGDTAIALAIRQAVSDGCQVINMSLRVSFPIVPAVEKAVKFAASKGILMVCAAGNSGDGDPTTNEMKAYPARWKETISVAAVRKSVGLPVATFSESNPEVDFAGIGVEVTSLKPGGGYQQMSGTSMASPHVAGLIAALMSNGDYKNSPKKLKKDLASKFAVDIAAEGRDDSTGVGFVTFLSEAEFNTKVSRGNAARAY